ncbi:MAG: hypothetical protein KDA80_15865, partial [Planctomycetaceae bacterium]|nr:hypothetical protein [Planctomycetaceae bacterium]
NVNLDSAAIDRDVQLVGDDSASDVQLIADDGRGPADDESTEMPLVSGASDVSLLSDDEQAMAIDFDDEGDSPGSGSVLSDESGISLGGDSSLLLGGESGISLEGPADSGIALDADGDEGITLAMDDDSGISLDAGDSGISLESIGDSGISLESDEQSGTIPMMDISDGDEPPETQFEIPSLQDDDESSYELQDDGDTGVFEVAGSLDDTGENELDDAVFDLDEGEDAYGGMDDAFDTDDGDFEDDAFAADDDLDVFDADDDMFGDVDEEESFVGGGGGMAMSQQEWGAGTFAGLTIATLCLLLCGAVMIDLVKNTATAAQPNPISGMVLDMLGGLYKG